MSFDTLNVDFKGTVATVRLSIGKTNAMSQKFFREFRECFEALAKDTNVRCIIVAANGKYFTVGLDLKDASSGLSGSESKDVARKTIASRSNLLSLQQAFNAIEACPQPVIVAVHGACVGGGVDLCCAADIRLCSEQAWFTIKEVDIGLCADLGTLQRLPKVIGNSSLVRELAYTARRFSGKEAVGMGLFSRCLPNEEALLQAAEGLAEEIASKSPVAIVGTKVNLNYARDHPVERSLEYQATWSSSMLQSEDLPKSFVASLSKGKAQYSKL